MGRVYQVNAECRTCYNERVFHSERGDVPEDIEEGYDGGFNFGDKDPAQRNTPRRNIRKQKLLVMA